MKKIIKKIDKNKFILEICFAISIIIIYFLLAVLLKTDFNNFKENILDLNIGIVNLNNALIVAFILCIASNKIFMKNGENYKAIARRDLLFFLLNSLILVLSPILEIFSLIISIPAIAVEIITFWGILRDFLEII